MSDSPGNSSSQLNQGEQDKIIKYAHYIIVSIAAAMAAAEDL